MPAEDDAERMADGIGEDPEASLALTSDPGGTRGEQFLFCLVGIAHANVEVRLLGMRRVGPAWGKPFGRPLGSHLP